MAPISTTIKIDPELKRQAQDLFGKLGMNLTTAVNIFLAQAVREQAIPFKVGLDVPNEETLAAINEVKELKKDPHKKTYGNFAELLEDLDNE